jgi:hypothetical protein
MHEPRPAVVRIVKSILSAELRLGGGDDSDVAQRIMTRLRVGLEKLVGTAGFDVLVARSLVLTKRAHPALAAVTVGPGGKLAGLDAVAGDVVGPEEGAMPLVAQFIELLVSLIGEDLALRLVRNSWPRDEMEGRK